ncbi:hypothetical protein CHH52_14470 [Shouchella clausii]|nr:hypothetical protein CHH52_14470 [Shouchella clausii]
MYKSMRGACKMDRRKKIQKKIAARRQAAPKRNIALNEAPLSPEKGADLLPQKRQSGIRRFVMQLAISGCLFFMIGIIYQSGNERVQPVQAFVEQTFNQHFQFAAVSAFFEKHLGSPLHLLPEQRASEEEKEPLDYAYPASGVIRESFDKDGKGILLETGLGEEVKAVKGGHVIRVTTSEESELGNLIELQHPDGTSSIYGMLDDVSVHPYDILESGAVLGTVSSDENQAGIFYFAIRQGDDYIDPSEVMNFD